MSLPSESRGYNSRAYISPAPGAFYEIFASDFGATTPAAATVATSSSAGSMSSSTTRVQITWVTAEGESLPSPVTAFNLAAGGLSAVVTIPTVPTNGQTVLGYRVYAASGATTALVPAAGIAQATSTVATSRGNLAGVVPIATTSVQVLEYGSGAPPATDGSGIQPALPSVASDATVGYQFIVPNTGSQWKVQKTVNHMRPDGVADPTGITVSITGYTQPVYPGVSTVVAAGAWMVLNGYLFLATAGGTTAAAFIGFSAFNTAKFANTTDGTVTWQCYGKAGLVNAVFSNLSGSAAVPAAQSYNFWES